MSSSDDRARTRPATRFSFAQQGVLLRVGVALGVAALIWAVILVLLR